MPERKFNGYCADCKESFEELELRWRKQSDSLNIVRIDNTSVLMQWLIAHHYDKPAAQCDTIRLIYQRSDVGWVIASRKDVHARTKNTKDWFSDCSFEFDDGQVKTR